MKATPCLMLGCLAGISALGGCSSFQVPTVQEAITHPLGTGAPFTLGTSKAEIREEWGGPAGIIPHGVDELGNVREEWIYHGWLPGLPIDHEYISRTKHLFFEGDNLVGWKAEAPPAGQSQGAETP